MVANVIIVTGGSRGIGAAVCLKAASFGFDIVVNYNKNHTAANEVVRKVKEEYGRRALAVQADISQYRQVKFMFEESYQVMGDIYGLVNNAGITGKSSNLTGADPNMISSVINTNLTGTILCTREAIKYMMKHGEAASIVNVSSGAATLGSANEFTWYAASKAGVDIFTYGVAQELAERNIRVNAVSPGLIDTELHTLSTEEPGRVERMRLGIPMRREGTVSEIAEPIMYLLSRNNSTYITGAVLRATGGR